jgi:hypothetical protein
LRENIAASVWKIEITAAGDPPLLYPQKLVLASPTSGGRSVGVVRSWTKATDNAAERIKKIEEKINHLIGTRTSDLPDCSTATQISMLPLELNIPAP